MKKHIVWKYNVNDSMQRMGFLKYLIIGMFLFILSNFAQGQATFNGDTLREVKSRYVGKVFVDSSNTQIYEFKMKLINGVLVPENGSVLSGYILIPTIRKNLTVQDLEDIQTLINYRDLKNKIKTE